MFQAVDQRETDEAAHQFAARLDDVTAAVIEIGIAMIRDTKTAQGQESALDEAIARVVDQEAVLEIEGGTIALRGMMRGHGANRGIEIEIET